MSNSLRPHGLYSPWNFPGQNTGVGSLSLLLGIFQTQGLNLGLPYCFPGGSEVKASASNVGDLGIPRLRRSPGEGKGYALQYSGLENSMDYTVHRVANSWTQLSDFHSLFIFNTLLL